MRSELSLRYGLIGAGLLTLAVHASVIARSGEDSLPGPSIYLQGKASEPATAYLSGPGISVDSRGFACAQCHLRDGSGSREGGVAAPDIRFTRLTQAYEGVRSTGRQHPAYDEESLRRAIREGVDPAGNPLHPVMPRYAFTDQDMRALIDYLKGLDDLQAPGVSAAAIRVGTLQPASGSLLPMSRDLRRLVRTYFEQINARGGIYGRRLELVIAEYNPEALGSQFAAVASLTSGDGVFCTLANLGVSDDSGAIERLGSLGVPELAPLRITLDNTEKRDRPVFYLYASLAEQGGLLVEHLRSESSGMPSSFALIHTGDPQALAAMTGTRRRLADHAWTAAAETSYPPMDTQVSSSLRRMQTDGLDTVVFLGDGGRLQAFLEDAARSGWQPRVFALADLSSDVIGSVSPEQARQLYLLSTLAIADAERSGMARFSALMERAGLPGRYQGMLFSTYAGLRLLQEGLERQGRKPTPEGFVGALNRLWKFETGTMPALTFGENRRSGTRGGSIVAIDADSKGVYRVSEWREM